MDCHHCYCGSYRSVHLDIRYIAVTVAATLSAHSAISRWLTSHRSLVSAFMTSRLLILPSRHHTTPSTTTRSRQSRNQLMKALYPFVSNYFNNYRRLSLRTWSTPRRSLHLQHIYLSKRKLPGGRIIKKVGMEDGVIPIMEPWAGHYRNKD